MSFSFEHLRNIGTVSLESLSGSRVNLDYVRSLEEDIRRSDEAETQYKTQIEMLEKEVDRQEIIIDALIKAIKVIERG